MKYVSISEMAQWNGGKDTNNMSRHEALNNAKDANGIARCISPFKTGSIPDRNTGEPLRTYTFKNDYGQVIEMREDRATVYPKNPIGNQSPHFNAGESEEKLKQHHNYGNKP